MKDLAAQGLLSHRRTLVLNAIACDLNISALSQEDLDARLGTLAGVSARRMREIRLATKDLSPDRVVPMREKIRAMLPDAPYKADFFSLERLTAGGWLTNDSWLATARKYQRYRPSPRS